MAEIEEASPDEEEHGRQGGLCLHSHNMMFAWELGDGERDKRGKYVASHLARARTGNFITESKSCIPQDTEQFPVAGKIAVSLDSVPFSSSPTFAVGSSINRQCSGAQSRTARFSVVRSDSPLSLQGKVG